jgi:hypothetical protein
MGATGEAVQGNGDIPHHPPLQVRQSSKESAHEDDENGESRVLVQCICVYFDFQLGVLLSVLYDFEYIMNTL